MKTLDIYINTNYTTNMKLTLLKIIGIALALAVLIWAAGRGIDQHFDNQDRMLCSSAKVSGNAEYLNKCECYYKGEAVSCIHRDSVTKSTDAGTREVRK